ncbi:LysM peptidoglycan-binding domain-containing protein [Lacipirellula parvula]|uniref:LysM domain-containing protein n=1 Tax=Lacipirellula parvula TaxID=2650471 RepID=A0A5K7XHS0_9BACT|nr:LysM peptidoglycan-binding domain-containing protein [Lacipirellula parvula]BBO35998.1 hypothetical protein PLANPX_5610 [Lacipirellula parvula]
MSSLRPLATITLLAVVGVVLYMKINETEPVIPEGVGEWTTGQLEIGGDPGASVPGVGGLSQAPKLDAPPLDATAAASAAPAGDAAPAWKPEPILSSKTDAAEAPKFDPTAAAPADKGATAESSPVARSADASQLPDMPPLPESNSTAKDAAPVVAAAAAAAAVPFVNTPSTGATPSAASAPAAESSAAASPAPSSNPYAVTPDASAVAPPLETPVAGSTPVADVPPVAEAPVAGTEPITPTDASKGSMYASARVAVQGDLDRGELAQALLKLSEWYGDPSLTPEETQEVDTLLGQLAGDVIYEGPPAHRLAPKHVVATGETLETIAQKYNVPWELLANINRITDPKAVQVGQELKVLQGPFSAVIDLGKRRMTLMLDRRYAGRFTIELDPSFSIEEGTWKVDQKLLTPVAGGVYGQPAGATEDRVLLLSNAANPTAQPAMLRGPGAADPVSAPPTARVIKLKAGDVKDVYDILSVQSTITVRR